MRRYCGCDFSTRAAAVIHMSCVLCPCTNRVMPAATFHGRCPDELSQTESQASRR